MYTATSRRSRARIRSISRSSWSVVVKMSTSTASSSPRTSAAAFATSPGRRGRWGSHGRHLTALDPCVGLQCARHRRHPLFRRRQPSHRGAHRRLSHRLDGVNATRAIRRTRKPAPAGPAPSCAWTRCARPSPVQRDPPRSSTRDILGRRPAVNVPQEPILRESRWRAARTSEGEEPDDPPPARGLQQMHVSRLLASSPSVSGSSFPLTGWTPDSTSRRY